MLTVLVNTIINLLGKVMPFLLVYKVGKDSAELDQAKEVLNEAKKVKEARDSVDSMSPDERDKWL